MKTWDTKMLGVKPRSPEVLSSTNEARSDLPRNRQQTAGIRHQFRDRGAAGGRERLQWESNRPANA